MKDLAALNKYFYKYRWRLLAGLVFVTLSNVFAVIPPALIREMLDEVQEQVVRYRLAEHSGFEGLMGDEIFRFVLLFGVVLIVLALLRGIFMFLMRQTLIVMSRHIEYDQKAEIYAHYQCLDQQFFRVHATGDLMNRISEDVARVRMYTGPCIMYATNLTVLTIGCLWGMMQVDGYLTLIVVLPLPLLAFTIFYVNKIIYKKSEQIQQELSDLTTIAQESYSGIRVIKSFVQEHAMMHFFKKASESYRKSATSLAMTEAVYFPAMNLFIGLSLLATIAAGGYLAIRGNVSTGAIAAFVIYLNLLAFPISSIGWVASMVQRAAASQKRINEFLQTAPKIADSHTVIPLQKKRGEIRFDQVSFTYPHTAIQALKEFSLTVKPGQRVAIIGRTGSGKSTVAQLLLRMYDPTSGSVLIDGNDIRRYSTTDLRQLVSYAPQDNYLFSDTIYNNICFGRADASRDEVMLASHLADLDKDISNLEHAYETVVGERGVMLSGGQKQRIVLARALIRSCPILILDETLSAVDNETERRVLERLRPVVAETTVIVITHRLFRSWEFDQILVLDDGKIVEQGTHASLMALGGGYARLWDYQSNG